MAAAITGAVSEKQAQLAERVRSTFLAEAAEVVRKLVKNSGAETKMTIRYQTSLDNLSQVTDMRFWLDFIGNKSVEQIVSNLRPQRGMPERQVTDLDILAINRGEWRMGGAWGWDGIGGAGNARYCGFGVFVPQQGQEE
jgi:hypothetical protein